MKEFTREDLKELRRAIDDALRNVERTYGVSLSIGNIRFDSRRFTTRLTGYAGGDGERGIPMLKLTSELDLITRLVSAGIEYKNIATDIFLSPDGETAGKLTGVFDLGAAGNIFILTDEEGEDKNVTQDILKTFALADRGKKVTISDYLEWAVDRAGKSKMELIRADRMSYHLFKDEDTEAVDAFIEAVNKVNGDVAFLMETAEKVFPRMMRGDYVGATKLLQR